MGVRIERIRINRGGPLEKDFEFEPSSLNLAYGGNETGKTFVVEALIRLLFRTGRRGPHIEWHLRPWRTSGRVVVSGLEDSPTSFTATGRKLEDYWSEGLGLPPDLSRLLVVRAGEPLGKALRSAEL